MKRIKLFVVLSTLTLLLSGCSIFGASKTAIALNNMADLDNYRMDMTFEIVNGETFSAYALVDGNYEQLHMLGETIHLITEEDGVYVIDYSRGLPVLELSSEYSDEDEDYDDFSLFEDVSFREDDGYWIMESDEPIFDGIDEVKFKLEDNYVKEMILSGTVEGVTMNISILYSKFNDVDVEIPNYLSEDEFDDFLDGMEEVFIVDIFIGEYGFTVNGYNFVVDCFGSSDVNCFFETEPGFDYNLGTGIVTDQEDNTYDTFAEFKSQYPSIVITQDTIDFIEYFDTLREK